MDSAVGKGQSMGPSSPALGKNRQSVKGPQKNVLPTWWIIPLIKWVITPVINGISRVNPLITGVITHILSGMSHQVPNPPQSAHRILDVPSCSILPGCPASLPEQSARMDLEWPGHRPPGNSTVCSGKSSKIIEVNVPIFIHLPEESRQSSHPRWWNLWSAGCFAAIRTCEKNQGRRIPNTQRWQWKIPYKWRFEWENGKTSLKHL